MSFFPTQHLILIYSNILMLKERPKIKCIGETERKLTFGEATKLHPQVVFLNHHQCLIG